MPIARERLFHFDPIQGTVSQVLDFLQEKSKSLQLNTVLGYVTSIYKRDAPVHGVPLSAEVTVRKWVSSLKLSNGVARSLLPGWSLDLVLAVLKQQPFESIRLASLKHLTWKMVFMVAIMSAHLVSELHALCYKEPYLAMSVTSGFAVPCHSAD